MGTPDQQGGHGGGQRYLEAVAQRGGVVASGEKFDEIAQGEAVVIVEGHFDQIAQGVYHEKQVQPQDDQGDDPPYVQAEAMIVFHAGSPPQQVRVPLGVKDVDLFPLDGEADSGTGHHRIINGRIPG